MKTIMLRNGTLPPSLHPSVYISLFEGIRALLFSLMDVYICYYANYQCQVSTCLGVLAYMYTQCIYREHSVYL